MTRPIDAIGAGNDRAARPTFSSNIKRKNPWEDIGNFMTGIVKMNLPEKFNSAFTVGGKGGTETEGAFRA